MIRIKSFRAFRKISEKFGRELREILVKKGCKMGGVSL
ncbi:glycosyltransferase [Capnocytophaga ochracea]